MKTAQHALNLVLMAAAGALMLVTIFTLAARLWWGFDLFSHFRLQYLIVAVLLSGAALAIGARPTAAVLAIVALVHGWAIKDLWWGGTASAGLEGVPLRLLSANVRSQNRTPEQALEFVRAADADLVVLIDARLNRWQPVLTALAAQYPYQAPQTWRERPRVVLFSRYPILKERLARAPGGRRPYLVAEVATGDRTLVIAGVHSSSPLPSGDSHSRNRELDHIAELARDPGQPLIVAGDFNTTPWSPHFQDLLAAAGLRNAADGHGYVGTWPTWFWPALIPIDHIMLKGPLAVTTIRHGPRIGSDHYPIIADLRLLSNP